MLPNRIDAIPANAWRLTGKATLLAVFLAGFTAPESLAQAIYDARLGTLPSSQGWAYVDASGNNPPPAVANGLLRAANVWGGQHWRRDDPSIDFTNQFVIEAGILVTSSNYVPNVGTGTREGYYFLVRDRNGDEYAIGLADSGVNINTILAPNHPLIPFPIAGTFRTFRLEIANRQASLYIDGSRVVTNVSPGRGQLSTGPDTFAGFGGHAGASRSVTDLQYFCFNTSGLSCSSEPPRIIPDRGGNSGAVTARIVGSGFQPGIQVKLVGTGPEIKGSMPSTLNPSLIKVTFDLSGALSGLRDVVVTDIDGVSITLKNAFTVEPGRAPQLDVKLLGRNVARIGSRQKYFLVVTNSGNIDSDAPVTAISAPNAVKLYPQDPPFQNTDSPMFAGTSVGEASAAKLFVFPSVPSNSSLAVPFDVEPSGGTFNLRGRLGSTNSDIDITKRTFEEYAASAGCPFVPYDTSCVDCYGPLVGYMHIKTGATDYYYESLRTAVEARRATLVRLIVETGLLAYNIGSARKAFQAILRSRPTLAALPDADELTALFSLVEGGVYDLTRSLTGSTTAGEFLSTMAKIDSVIDKTRLFLVLGGGIVFPQLDALIEAYEMVKPTLLAGSAFFITKEQDKIAWDEFNRIFNQYCSTRQLYVDCFNNRCGRDPQPYIPLPTPGPGESTLSIQPVGSVDPNDKYGPMGADNTNFIKHLEPLSYGISFENLPAATAAARTVKILDQLDPLLVNISTFSCGPISIAKKTIVPEALAPRFEGDVDLRPEQNILVHVTCDINQATGLANWEFETIDPATGSPPDDPLVGFLPPNRISPDGQGSVSFSVAPVNSLGSGSVIANFASIIFDANSPIVTPVWRNTVDMVNPVSKVAVLPPSSRSLNVPVSWSGTDDVSGIRDYSVFVSEDGALYEPWLIRTDATSAVFTGKAGRTYRFYSTARDRAGNEEARKQIAEATTRIDVECASTPSALVVSRGGFRFNVTTGRYIQAVTIQNRGTSPVSGPISLMLTNVSESVNVFNATGFTACAEPSVSPYVNVVLSPGTSFLPGQIATLTLEFTNPTNQPINYTTRVLAGPGSR